MQAAREMAVAGVEIVVLGGVPIIYPAVIPARSR
jgi:hypothetical protein